MYPAAFATHRSWMRMRLVLLQIWPLVQKAPNMTHSTALSRSADTRRQQQRLYCDDGCDERMA
jgi:hypothetical protein